MIPYCFDQITLHQGFFFSPSPLDDTLLSIRAPSGDVVIRPHVIATEFILLADIFTYNLNKDTDIFESRRPTVTSKIKWNVYISRCVF